MIEINWDEIDPKYGWFAVDEDGTKVVYLSWDKPYTVEHSHGWHCCGMCQYVGGAKSHAPNWKESLQERP